MKKLLFFMMLMVSAFAQAQDGTLGKIIKVKPAAVIKYPTRTVLRLEISLWRRYMNTPYYCVCFSSKSPLPGVKTIEELKNIATTTNCGIDEKNGLKYTEEEVIYVDVPLDKSMLTQSIYVSGYVVTSGETTEFRRKVYKNVLAYKHAPLTINPQQVKTIESSESFNQFASAITQTMYSNLYGIDENGNQICKSCDGFGCEKCKWRGWENDALTNAAQMMRSSANAKKKTSTDKSRSMLNGQHTKTFPNGDKYTGTFVNGLCTGKGTYYYANGDKYVGDFMNNQFHGKGTLTIGKDKYVGDFVHDLMEGKGTFYLADEMKYVGCMKNDNMDGEGTMYFLKEKEYIKGIFKDGDLIERTGHGKIAAPNSSTSSRKANQSQTKR